MQPQSPWDYLQHPTVTPLSVAVYRRLIKSKGFGLFVFLTSFIWFVETLSPAKSN